MTNTMVTIDNLIEIVRSGGKVKTGVDVYNRKGTLLLEKTVLVEKPRTLEIIKENGIRSVMVNASNNGGLWDENGNQIQFASDKTVDPAPSEEGVPLPTPEKGASLPPSSEQAQFSGDLGQRLQEIEAIKKQAAVQYQKAKDCIKTAIGEIKQDNGRFDINAVEDQVLQLSDFLVSKGHPFSYLNREIFSFDDYLFNHSINVCATATAVVHRFNTHFSRTVERFLSENSGDIPGNVFKAKEKTDHGFRYYYPDEITDMSLGFFLYDIGKVMIPEQLLNKNGRLTPKEFDTIKRHSYEYGTEILEKNNIQSAVLKNIVAYHHAPLFHNEEGCYPTDKDSSEIPLYVKICKLADIYDAMTSKRSYKEALNQISAVTEVFRTYVKKNTMLQFILHAFVKSIGIYPPGSIVFLKNRQMAYVLESKGPLVLPFTDTSGNTLHRSSDPVDLAEQDADPVLAIDSSRSIRTPKEVYNLLPEFLREAAMSA
ncbi:MAG TPA: HD domain-containing phosphohydrolase [Desulfotignum sp.]|nr:HD domain-containing phosphohydrolase [Desulfotignum sp.]